MCFDTDSRPPITPIAGGALDGAAMTLTSADGTQFGAFAARAAVARARDPGPVGSAAARSDLPRPVGSAAARIAPIVASRGSAGLTPR